MRIKFSTSRANVDVIAKIAKRAETLQPAGFEQTRLDWIMDITACHLNGCPLRLADLLAADKSNFAHDVFGIRRHINRETGRIEGGFLPRFHALTDSATKEALS